MKKLLLISVLSMFMISGCFIFDYNGNAEVVIRNIGELVLFAQIETGYSIIEPGEEDTFKLSWPGHDTLNVNLITYPYQNPQLGASENFDIKDGDLKILERGFYLSDIQ